jgi:hypothetical protein
MDTLEIFSVYKNLGYQIIPLYPNSKIPMFSGWQKNYSYEKIEKIVKSTSQDINFGLILGEIIDLEGDCVDSNQILDDILANIDHPTFSSNKSKHHLFKSSLKNLTKVEFDGIEVRGYRHQSVIPPSKHITGCNYQWLTNIIHANNIPELPKFLHDKILSLVPKYFKQKNKKGLKPNHSKINCSSCNKNIMMNTSRINKEIAIFKSNLLVWMCFDCRPFDIRKAIKNPNKTLKTFS